MLRTFFHRHALALSACLVAAGSAGVTSAVAQGGCPCALTNHVGVACVYGNGNNNSTMSIHTTPVFISNSGGGQSLAYYICDVFGYWKQIDCGGNQNGADGCTATVAGRAVANDGTVAESYLNAAIAGLCGSPCTQVVLPSTDLNNPPRSDFSFGAVPGQDYTVTLRLCDGCTNQSGCGGDSILQTQMQDVTPGS